MERVTGLGGVFAARDADAASVSDPEGNSVQLWEPAGP